MTRSIDPDRPPAPPAGRLVAIARLLRGITVFSQIALMFALFLMWKQFQVPFVKAFERCFVAGITIYVVLGTISSVLLTIARIQPIHFLLRQLFGVVSVVIFAALHYVYKLGILQSAGAWALIYFGARLLVWRIESRASRHFTAR
jgi:hypothetical protein